MIFLLIGLDIGHYGSYGRLRTILCSINLLLTCTILSVRIFFSLIVTVESRRTLMTNRSRSFLTASSLLGMDSFVLKLIHLMYIVTC
eukprot:c23236_g3_i1 orf=1487-1747(+)